MARPDPALLARFTDAACAWHAADRAEVALWTSREMGDLSPLVAARVEAQERLMATVAALEGMAGFSRHDASLILTARRWRAARIADAAPADLVTRMLAAGDRLRAERALRAAVGRWMAGRQQEAR